MKEVGILQPLIVYASDDDPNKYVLYSGYNRLRAAQEIGLSEVPCIVAESKFDAIRIEYDTDLCRRHLSETQKQKFTAERDRKINKHIRTIVAPEIYDLYESGVVDTKTLKILSNLPTTQQEMIVSILKENAEEGRNGTEDNSADVIADYEAKIEELQSRIAELEANSANIEKLKKSINEKLKEKEREIIEKYRGESTDKIQQMIEDERASIHAEYKTDIEELSKNLRDMSRAKADAQKTIDTLKEELQKYKSKEQEHKAITDKLKDELFVAKTTLQKAVDTETLSKRLDIIVQDALKTFELSVLLGVEAFADDNLKKAMDEKAQQLQEIAIEMMQFFSSSEGSKKKK
jgi:chromosome segregation ATPase